MTKAKSESFEKFKTWKIFVDNEVGRTLRVLKFDNGGEFVVSKEFTNFYKQHEIQRRFTTHGDPQSNSVAEKMNMTILEKTRCLRLTVGLSKCFWTEGLSAVPYIINRIPRSDIDGKIPRKM